MRLSLLDLTGVDDDEAVVVTGSGVHAGDHEVAAVAAVTDLQSVHRPERRLELREFPRVLGVTHVNGVHRCRRRGLQRTLVVGMTVRGEVALVPARVRQSSVRVETRMRAVGLDVVHIELRAGRTRAGSPTAASGGITITSSSSRRRFSSRTRPSGSAPAVPSRSAAPRVRATTCYWIRSRRSR